MSEIINIKNSEKLDVGFDAWKLHDFEQTVIIQIRMDAGKIVESHVNEKTVIFYVLSGSGKITIDGEAFELVSNDSIKVEKMKMRSWENPNKTDLHLLVVKYM